MKLKSMLAAFLAICLVFVGCSRASEKVIDQTQVTQAKANGSGDDLQRDSTPGDKSLTTAVDFPVIMHLEMRDRWITVKSGPAGPVYFVKTKDGKIIANDLTEEQMQAQCPDLLFELKHMTAARSSRIALP